MDKKTLERALFYCEASLKDLQWQWNTMNLEGFNMNTSGTQSFDSELDVENYLEGMAIFLDHLKEILDAEG